MKQAGFWAMMLLYSSMHATYNYYKNNKQTIKQTIKERSCM